MEASPDSRLHASGSSLRDNGSWLDMAEFELTVLASQCLDRRIPDFYEFKPRGRWY